MCEQHLPEETSTEHYTSERAEAELCALGSLPVSDAVSLWLQRIRRYPLLSAEQELQLSLLAKQGDQEARCLLVNSNLRLVVSIARRYLSKGLSFSDLMQEGNIGLIYAITKFEPSRGFRFCTYAGYWIRHAVTRAIAQQARSIRLPVYLVEEINSVQRCSSKLSALLGRQATVDEVAHEMNMGVAELNEMLCLSEEPVSLERPFGNERPLAETLVDHNLALPASVYEQSELLEELAHAIDSLSDRDRLIVIKRYGLDGNRPHTLAEVASELGISRQRVKQLEQAALDKIRLATEGE